MLILRTSVIIILLVLCFSFLLSLDKKSYIKNNHLVKTLKNETEILENKTNQTTRLSFQSDVKNARALFASMLKSIKDRKDLSKDEIHHGDLITAQKVSSQVIELVHLVSDENSANEILESLRDCAAALNLNSSLKAICVSQYIKVTKQYSLNSEEFLKTLEARVLKVANDLYTM